MATVLYAIPHQDDETLSMGASIRAHLKVGHDVHVLLFTTGVNSGARAATGLSEDYFVRARDDEYTRATRRLGVRPWNLHISATRVEDGYLTVLSAEAQLRAWLDDHPGAWVKTYSNRSAPGRHDDHMNLGQAAVNLLGNGEIVANGLRLYVEPWMRAAFTAANPGVTVSAEDSTSSATVQAALDEYNKHDAAAGFKYGIGWASVPTAFTTVKADPRSWYHLP